MYLYHFGLRELPFTLTPNTNFYLALEPHNEALAVLMTALKTGEGFIKVIGEVGTGKTTTITQIIPQLKLHEYATIYISNSDKKPNILLNDILRKITLFSDEN